MMQNPTPLPAAFQHPHEAALRKIKAALVRDTFPTSTERYQAESLFGKLLVGGRYDIDNGSKISSLFFARRPRGH